MGDKTAEKYAKFVEDWPRTWRAQHKGGRVRFSIDDIKHYVQGACDLIAEDIREGKVK